MAYVTRMIAEGESLIGVSRLHWIYLVKGLCWLIGLMAAGFLIDALIATALGALSPVAQWHFMGLQATWLELFFIAAGLYLFVIHFVKVATTELALSDQRIIYKVGWIFVNVQEMNLDEIRGTHIDMGALGRFLGYGSISFDARFVGDMVTGSINRPYRFIRAMNEAQQSIEDRLSMVIDGKDGAISLRPADKETAVKMRRPSEEKPAPPAKPISADNRPAAQAHEVAEGSFEEEKLSEELNREWDEHAENDDTHTPPASRQIH